MSHSLHVQVQVQLGRDASDTRLALFFLLAAESKSPVSMTLLAVPRLTLATLPRFLGATADSARHSCLKKGTAQLGRGILLPPSVLAGRGRRAGTSGDVPLYAAVTARSSPP